MITLLIIFKMSDESDAEVENEPGSDLEMDDNFSDRSFESETESEDDDGGNTQATDSTLETLDSQASGVDDEFWSDELADVDMVLFSQPFGPNHPLTPTSAPLEYFFLMCDEEFFHRLAAQTNLYATQQQTDVLDPDWYPTTTPEMMAFVGILIFMGIVQLPNARMYWKTNKFLGNVGIMDTMPRNRFFQLERYLHLNDNEAAVPQGQPGYDRLHKVRPLINMARQNFRIHYRPGQDQAIDEGMVKYRGRYFPTSYCPAKPVKRGLKIWMRCETNGYCGDFRAYLGKHDEFKGKKLGERVVKHFCRPLKWKYHRIFCDKFFTSLRLARTLEGNGIYFCGAMNKRAIGIPEDMRNPDLLRGDTVQKQHDNTVLTVWQDTKPVHILTTGCNPVGDDPAIRRVRGVGQIEISRPPTVTQYSQHMGGVDRCMQHRAKNPVGRPSKKYWKYLMNFILELCLINAFQVWKGTPGTRAQKPNDYKLVDFRVDVATNLIGDFSCRRMRNVNNQNVQNSHVHSRLDRKRSTCKFCTKRGEKKRRETLYGCALCNVHLCEGRCFQAYHQEHNLPTN